MKTPLLPSILFFSFIATTTGCSRPTAESDFMSPSSLNEKIAFAIDQALAQGSKSVSVSGDGEGDFGQLHQIEGLETLDLSCGELNDLTFLNGLKELRSLTIQSDAIVDLAPIGTLSNLEHLSLTLSSGEELPPLQGLKNLRKLQLYYCGILTDVRALHHAGGLEELSIIECEALEDLSPVSNCKSLTSIKIEECASVADVTALETLPQLQTLVLRNTSVQDVSGFQEKPGLQVTLDNSTLERLRRMLDGMDE